MSSNHEEADTKLVLHSCYSSNFGAKRIVVSSPDTDVPVLQLHHFIEVDAKELYFLTGHYGAQTSMRHYILIHGLHKKMKKEELNVMLPVYAITGCDTVSGFYGHGKTKTFNLMRQHSDKFKQLSMLGTSSRIPSPVFRACIEFVSLLYGMKVTSLNELRCLKTEKGLSGKKLSPTKDSFYQHILRSSYQLMIWRQATNVTKPSRSH